MPVFDDLFQTESGWNFKKKYEINASENSI
jgi:hypothetical protein